MSARLGVVFWLGSLVWLPAQEDLGPLLEPLRQQYGVPALGAAVLVDGELHALGAVGVRRRGHEAAVTVDDRWHLGSCTKAMTATLLARQVEAGKVAWTTTLAEALPDLADRLHAGARGITLAQLLQHRAGLPAQPPDALWGELFRFAGTDAEARTEVATAMLAVAPEAAPGTRFLYSNASYMLAGAISERLGGSEWNTLVAAQLFTPLGITSAGFGPPGTDDATDQPWGHRPQPKGPVAVFADNPPSLGPAGTVHMALRDWARFAALHLGVVPVVDGKPLLQPDTLRALHTPPEGADYALGWRVARRDWAPGPILTHAGSNTMWFCVAWLAPEARFGVLVTCNQGDAAAACDAVAAACIARYRPAAR
ncbi:MAG: beta-lactamase family protein [Planctomycetes bacterium]|nr:beta-lactamase family protein [Planctomycetota bacterium]